MRGRILVVDDEAPVRDWLRAALEAAGYTVEEAATAEEARAQLGQTRFAALLLDLHLPETSGFDLLRRARREHPELEVVIVTGHADLEVSIECLRLGVADLLRKPCAGPEVVAAVACALARRRQRSASRLFEASQVIFSSLADPRLAQRVAEAAGRVVAADEVSLMLVEADGRLHVAYSSGLDPTAVELPSIALGERIAGRVLLERTPLILNGPAPDDRRFRDVTGDTRIRSSLVYPLCAGERAVGVLNLSRVASPRPFAAADLELVAVLASSILLALENGRLTRQVVGAGRLASVGLVAASVGHEINNPLAYALASHDFLTVELKRLGELLGRLEDGGDPAAARDSARTLGGRAWLAEVLEASRELREGLERIHGIALDLRAVARVDVDGQPGIIDLNAPVRSAIRVASAAIRAHATVVEDLGAGAMVRGSPARLSQVFINLLVNAGQALAGITAGPRRITITTRRDGPEVLAQVADTGPGISPEHLPRLFDPFFTTKDPASGTGLGLAISRDIVRRHGGDIRVVSAPGAGATFTVALPAAEAVGVDAPAPAAAPAAPPRDAAPRRCRLLIVDDEAGVRRALSRWLGRDHDVEVAEGGEAAARLLAAGARFDLILSDLLMPDLDGMALYTRAVAADPSCADAFVFMTGSSGLRDFETSLLAAGRRVLHKPLDLRALGELIAVRAARPR